MQIVDLQYSPGIITPVIHVSQMDVGRQFQLRVFNDDGTAYSMPAGSTLSIDGIKPDKKAFSYTDNITISGNIITITTKLQMTCVQGEVSCEVRFKKDGNNVGTLNFKMLVEPSPINEDADISNTELPAIIELAEEEAQMAIEAAGRASLSATSAQTSATAAGNSATAAAQSATSADTNALKSEGFAVGKQNNVDVPTTSPYYHKNAKYYAEVAGQYSVNTPYIGANGNWWVWDAATSAYVDSGVDASITVQIADITMLDPDATPNVTNTGTDTDPIFHLFIPRGKGISQITKTNTSGLVDTYTITYSDGSTYNYTVTNGKTAYQSAVEGGYTGTEAQFEADLANFKAWRDDAVQAASDAEDSADDAANEATNAHQSYLDAKAQADRAQAYADFLEPHFVIADNQLCIANDAVGEFIVADNQLCIKFVA